MISITGAINGASISGFTSPVFTFTNIVSQANNKILSVVSSMTGTSTATVHSVDNPFTAEFTYPTVWKTIYQGLVDGVSGRTVKVPFNEINLLSRKGCSVTHPSATVALNLVNEARTKFKIFAGLNSQAQVELGALMSCHAGLLSTKVDGMKSTVQNGY